MRLYAFENMYNVCVCVCVCVYTYMCENVYMRVCV